MWPSLVQHEQGQRCGFVLGVKLHDGVQTPALLFEVTNICGEPQPALDDEGTGAAEVVSYESRKNGSEVINHAQADSPTRGLSVLLLCWQVAAPTHPFSTLKLTQRTYCRLQRVARQHCWDQGLPELVLMIRVEITSMK